MMRAQSWLLLLPVASATLPDQILGMYVLLADDSDKARPTHWGGPKVGPYNSTTDWTPRLHPYQQEGTNTLYLTFLNPALMPAVPPSFAALSKSRGKSTKGAVPAGTAIIFAIGGQAYSEKKASWEWLTTKEKAVAMGKEVAQWPAKYGCDGIDLDVEAGIGDKPITGENLVHFLATLHELAPKMSVTQPVEGTPGNVKAPNRVLEASYNKSKGFDARALGSVSKVGIMDYHSAGNFVDTYVNGCSQFCSKWMCPLAACIPAKDVVLGLTGAASAEMIAAHADDVKARGLGGIMVWYATVLDDATGEDALKYQGEDASNDKLGAWATGLKVMRKAAPAQTATLAALEPPSLAA